MNNITINSINTIKNNLIAKGYQWVESWLFSTNAKQIGILYGIFSLFSGIVGLSLSIIMRLELAALNLQILMHNGQLFNVLVTAHAVFMIFFMVMLITMGAFGKIKNKGIFICNKRNLHINNNNKELNELKLKIGLYLAGLIEGNGTITVHKEITKKRYSLLISIVFKSNDKLQMEYLYSILNIGKFYSHKTYYIWQITTIEEVYKVLYITNGYFRTLKIQSLIKAINWINLYIYNFTINEINLLNLKGLDKINYLKRESIVNKISYIDLVINLDNSLLNNNSWLSGFTDADGNFSIILNKRKNNNYRLFIAYVLEIRQKFHDLDNKFNILDINNLLNYKNVEINISYWDIMNNISNLFNTGLYSRTRNLKLKNQLLYKGYHSYTIRASSMSSLNLVNEYFDKYSLISSKFNNYKDWQKLYILINKYGSTDLRCIQLAIETKLLINKNRTIFNWDHLNIKQ